MLLYYLARGFFKLFLPLFGRWKVMGHENVPKSGGVIIVPNHVSYADPPVVGSALHRQVHFMAKEELFKIPFLGRCIAIVGAFPVKQKTADRAAIRKAIELLESGKVVCLFPEGRRTEGTLEKAELGIGMIAMKARVPIVPMALIGTNKLLPPHSIFLKFAKVRVIIGKPIQMDDLYEKGSERETLEEIGRRIMAAIAELQNSE